MSLNDVVEECAVTTEAVPFTSSSAEPSLSGDVILVGPNKDPFFHALAAINVHVNYFRLTHDKRRRADTYQEGHERSSLYNTILCVDCPGIWPKAVTNPKNATQPISMTRSRSIMGVFSKVLSDDEDDGAYIIVPGQTKGKYRISTEKHHLDSPSDLEVIDKVRKRSDLFHVNGREDVYKHYLPTDFVHYNSETPPAKVGTRTYAALSVPIYLGGGTIYVLKQTVYNGGNVGKACMFTKDGLAAEFFLAKDAELSPALRRSARNNEGYIDLEEGIAGVLRTYPVTQPLDKRIRDEYIIPLSALELPMKLPAKYARLQ